MSRIHLATAPSPPRGCMRLRTDARFTPERIAAVGSGALGAADPCHATPVPLQAQTARAVGAHPAGRVRQKSAVGVRSHPRPGGRQRGPQTPPQLGSLRSAWSRGVIAGAKPRGECSQLTNVVVLPFPRAPGAGYRPAQEADGGGRLGRPTPRSAERPGGVQGPPLSSPYGKDP